MEIDFTVRLADLPYLSGFTVRRMGDSDALLSAAAASCGLRRAAPGDDRAAEVVSQHIVDWE
jgi:hypothetical protein